MQCVATTANRCRSETPASTLLIDCHQRFGTTKQVVQVRTTGDILLGADFWKTGITRDFAIQ